MSPDEKKKLFDAIGYEGEDTSTSTYPEEVRSLCQYSLCLQFLFSILISI